MSSGSAIRRASAVEYHLCPELQLPMGHVKEALAAVLHTILLGRSIGGQSCVEPITVSSEVIDIHYSKSDDPHVDRTVKAALQEFGRFLERRPERKASIVLSFFVPKHRSSMTGGAAAAPAGSWTFNVIADFLSGVSDNREMFEQWTIPVHVVPPSHSGQGVSREVKAAIRSGDVISGVMWYICQRMLKSSRVQLPKPGVAGSRSCYDFEITNKADGPREQFWPSKFDTYRALSDEVFAMGIKGLYEFFKSQAPSAIRECRPEEFAGKRLAIDASIWMYQFKNKIRYEDKMLTNSKGECTSGVHGFLHRTIKMLELGIRPIFVFDGHPPAMKRDCLRERRIQAMKQERSRRAASSPIPASEPSSHCSSPSTSNPQCAVVRGIVRRLDFGDPRPNNKGLAPGNLPLLSLSRPLPLLLPPATTVYPRRLTQEEEYVVDVVKYLGCEYVLAPGEAEATCAQLCKEGKADAVSTEDIDAVVFGAPLVLKNLSNTLHRLEGNGGSRSKEEATNNYVREISRDIVLDALGLTAESLAELAILCGCDYCPSIPKIGPSRAYALLLKHGNITSIITAIEGSKSYKAPSEWAYREAKELFLNPSITAEVPPKPAVDVDALADLLVNRLNYNPTRVDTIKTRVNRIGETNRAEASTRTTGGKRQSTLLEFAFTPVPKRSRTSATETTPSTAASSQRNLCDTVEVVDLDDVSSSSEPSDINMYSKSFII
ncbi:Gen1p [Perkinsus olseni]|uniref:Gen1p n=1 Tax=Perkinsus olseni TaxID=32597 RepID=A0A7J6LXQ2_PEROL|nr:Gen1p [Perkinsus olseni]KAF4664072.1 Gen1p [Perkinsus olseni]